MNIMNTFRAEKVVLLPEGTAGCPHGQVIGPSQDAPGLVSVLTGAGRPIVVDLNPEQLQSYSPQEEDSACRCRMA